jgi:hypothetical protein
MTDVYQKMSWSSYSHIEPPLISEEPETALQC